MSKHEPGYVFVVFMACIIMYCKVVPEPPSDTIPHFTVAKYYSGDLSKVDQLICISYSSATARMT